MSRNLALMGITLTATLIKKNRLMTKMPTSPIPSLRLWQMISPAFPVGAYAYSTGLEAAVEACWVSDELSAKEWIVGQLTHNFVYLDAAVFIRVWDAFEKDDIATVNYWNGILLAFRETMELKQEDVHLGAALLKILKDLETAPPEEIIKPLSYVTSFAYGSSLWHIGREEAAMGLLWGWVENQVAGAIKLIPLGQTAGQRIMSEAVKVIPDVVQKSSTLEDEEIGFSPPGVAMASAAHEIQYSRLFRS